MVYKALRKMIFGTLNCSSTLQRKLTFKLVAAASIFARWMVKMFNTHSFFECQFPRSCWNRLLTTFQYPMSFFNEFLCETFKGNVLQILFGPSSKPKFGLLYVVKGSQGHPCIIFHSRCMDQLFVG